MGICFSVSLPEIVSIRHGGVTGIMIVRTIRMRKTAVSDIFVEVYYDKTFFSYICPQKKNTNKCE